MESTEFFEVASSLKDILQIHCDERFSSFEPDQINLNDLIQFTGTLLIPTLRYTKPQLYEIVNQKLSFLVSLLEHKFKGQCWRGIYVEEDFYFADSLESTDFWFASQSIKVALIYAFYRKTSALLKKRLRCFKKDKNQGNCILFRIQAHNAYDIDIVGRDDEILIPPSNFSITGVSQVSQIDLRRLVEHHLGCSHDFISEDIILIEMLQL